MTENRSSLPSKNSKPHAEQIDRVVAEYVDRLNAGERIDPIEVIATHPNDGEQILERLETYVGFVPSGDKGPLGTLGDYTLRRQIGRGGMGVVYEAWQNSVERQVALKVLPPGVAADERALQRFVREAKTAANLNHPHVVRVHGMGVEENTAYYSMELVEGETLAQLLPKIREAEPDAETLFGRKGQPAFYSNLASAFADVADGLQHAHSKGVIHRDIKPSNLILDGEGCLRILDFGLAHLEGKESLTISGDVVGTPLYMSPEQARRKKIPVDHRTDVYSLGATMYETLTGRPPFRGKDHQDTLSQIIERDPVEPRKLNPRVPSELATIVLKCLRKDPGDRYGTAEALAQDLGRFVRGDPIEARPEGPWARIVRRSVRKRRLIGTRILVVALLLTGGALLYSVCVRERAEGRFGNVVPVVEANSEYADIGPTCSADGRELYFCSERPGGLGNWDIWVVSRSEPRGPWGDLRNVEELNSSANDQPGWVSSDGLRLYYLRIDGLEPPYVSYIGLATRTESIPGMPWTPGASEDLWAINRTYPDVKSPPSLTGDELLMTFSSDRAGGAGGYDIWIATRPDRNAPWGEPQNVEEINTRRGEIAPCLSADGLTMWWTLRIPGEIWYASRASRGSRFRPARLVNEPVNSPIWDGLFEVPRGWPASGAVAYLVRMPAWGKQDIYQVTWQAGGDATSYVTADGKASR